MYLQEHGIKIECLPEGVEPVKLRNVDPFDAAIAGHAKYTNRVLFTTDKKIRESDIRTKYVDV